MAFAVVIILWDLMVIAGMMRTDLRQGNWTKNSAVDGKKWMNKTKWVKVLCIDDLPSSIREAAIYADRDWRVKDAFYTTDGRWVLITFSDFQHRWNLVNKQWVLDTVQVWDNDHWEKQNVSH